jgi:hypothetical protein
MVLKAFNMSSMIFSNKLWGKFKNSVRGHPLSLCGRISMVLHKS